MSFSDLCMPHMQVLIFVYSSHFTCTVAANTKKNSFFVKNSQVNLTGESRTEQNRTEQSRTEQNRTEQNRTEQSRTEQNRAEQNRTEQNRA